MEPNQANDENQNNYQSTELDNKDNQQQQTPQPPTQNQAPPPQQPQQQWQDPTQPVSNQWQPQQPNNFQQNQPQQPAPVAQNTSNSGAIILQWLTYAFWGWTILAMSVLTAIVFYSFFGENDTGSFTVYVIAAVLVLLPISSICDRIYSRQEPAKKHGGESIVMIIHAVIFALFGIAAVIGAVFALVNMATSSTDKVGSKVTLFSALVIAILYAAVFIRTMNFKQFSIVKKHFTKFMILAVGIILVFGIFGPLAKTRATRDDRLITSNINSVTNAIGKHTSSNNKLPEKLSQLSLEGDTKVLIDKNLLEYTPNTKPPDFGIDSEPSDNSLFSGSNRSDQTTYYYTICATFKEAEKDKYSSGYKDSYEEDGDGYQSASYISIYYHDAGKQCYKIKEQGF